MKANEVQIGGDHYRGTAIQHWDVMISIHADYLTGIATKYTSRHKKKNKRQDIEKAQHCIVKMRENPPGLLRRIYNAFLMQRAKPIVTTWLKELDLEDAMLCYAILIRDFNSAQAIIANILEQYDSEPDSRYTNQG